MTDYHQPLRGYVIGGPAHGQQFDPDKTGRVLRVPRQEPTQVIYVDEPIDSAKYHTSRVEYKLHDFYSTDGTDRIKCSVWLPANVEKHEAVVYLITIALRAPSDDKNLVHAQPSQAVPLVPSTNQ